MNNLKILPVATGLLASLLALSVAAANTPPQQKDAQIISKILETALEGEQQSGNEWWPRSPRIEALYLSGQGMLFNIQVHGSPAPFGFRMRTPVVAPVPPVAPVAPIAPAGTTMPELAPLAEMDFDDESHEIEMFVEEIVEGALENARRGTANAQQLRARSEELRKAREQMEKQIEAQSQVMEQLSEKMASRDRAQQEKARAEMEKASQEIQKAQNQYRTRVQQFSAEQAKRWSEGVSKLQDRMLDTLCDYAGSTRKLPANEYITLLFRNAATGESGNHQVFVLKRADLDACASGAQSAGFLRKRAISYTL